MPEKGVANRWTIAVAAVVMQICLGAVYGWSVFVQPLMRAEHWTLSRVSLNFTLAILFLGIGTIIGGLWQDRVGPRRVATVAGIIYGIGYILSGFASSAGSLWGMYVSYGVISGIGMGMGYITPVATLVKWFPDKRGLMTGVAVAGYGAGALIFSPIAARMIQTVGVPTTFWVFGIVYLILVVAAAQFYANPPAGWQLPNWKPTSTVAKSATKENFTVGEAMRTWQFWLLWVMLFLNVSAGIMIISQASPMAQQLVGMTPIAAAGMVGLISIFNGAGRVFWAWVSDMIGRAPVYFILYAIQAIIFVSLTSVHNTALFSLMFALIGLCYGGGFGTMPSFTADFFGPKFMGGIYGWILLAWGVGAAPSPILIARVRETTGGYAFAIHVIAVVMFCSLILPVLAAFYQPRAPRRGTVADIGRVA
jgi:MFS transporter, OFA family, oxalate/formate antiporter